MIHVVATANKLEVSDIISVTKSLQNDCESVIFLCIAPGKFNSFY